MPSDQSFHEENLGDHENFPHTKSIGSEDVHATQVDQQKIGPYCMVREIGRGGMGVVWLAVQEEPVKRQVALKIIRAEFATEELLVRFDAERQALALMNHPNIAGILDVGQTSLGQPYLAMEYVDGSPLTRFCDSESLSIRERLELFTDVCDAVQHAHQKGIIHRDLKPANILVAQSYGKAKSKVIDFGLAKAIRGMDRLLEQSFLTETGRVLGTYKYMSPEQADFENLDIDTRTDVYALGVILYELLTGITPLETSTIKGMSDLKILERIRDVEPIRPSLRLKSYTDPEASEVTKKRQTDFSRLNRILTGDLDWIVMKALEKEPARRYDSASKLAEDVCRFLNEEPVIARPPSVSYRLRKFIRKRRGLFIAASLVVVTLLSGTAGTTWGLFRALKAERIANANLTVAEERGQLAIEAIQRFSATVASNAELKHDPDLAILRESLLSEPIAFLGDLLESMRDTADTRPKALQRLGDVAFGLGSITAEIGDIQGALEAHEQSTSIYEQLVRENPLIAELQSRLAQNYNETGRILRNMGRSKEAMASFVDALELREKLCRDNPLATDFRDNLAASHINIGLSFADTDNTDKAIESYRKALEIFDRMPVESPQSLESQLGWAIAHNNIGVLLYDKGKFSEALSEYNLALAIREQLAHENATDVDQQIDLATTYGNVGNALSQVGQRRRAIIAHEQGANVLDDLVLNFPSLNEVRYQLAGAYNNIGTIQRAGGDPDAALQSHGRGIEILRELIRKSPSSAQFLHAIATGLYNQGILLSEIGQPEEALEAFQRILAIEEKLAKENPEVAKFQFATARSQYNIGLLTRDARNPKIAMAAFKNGLAIYKKLAVKDPDMADYQCGIAASLDAIGATLTITGTYEEAISSLRDASKIYERMSRNNPSSIRFRRNLATSYLNMAMLLKESGDFEDASNSLKRAVELLQDLVTENPSLVEFQSLLETAQDRLDQIQGPN